MKHPSVTFFRESIWRRDLLDNRAGETLKRFVVPPFLMLFGIGGFAFSLRVSFGLGELYPHLFTSLFVMSMGMLLVASRTLQQKSERGMKVRKGIAIASISAGTVFAILALATGIWWNFFREANQATEPTSVSATRSHSLFI